MSPRALEVVKYREGDLIQYNLHGNPELRYGVVEKDYRFLVYVDNDSIVKLWRQVPNKDIHRYKEGAYLRNVHRNLGQISFKQYMHDNPEYFI